MQTSTPREFLATTPLNTFWDKAKSILFIGEWCKTYDNKSTWEKLDYETLDSPLIDHDPDTVLIYIYKIYNILLPKLAQWFNNIHSTQHSLEYWEIVSGPFLFIHIKTIYDRYHRLKSAYARYPNLITIGLSKTSFLTPLNTTEYYEMTMFNDALNLQIMTQIISTYFDSAISHKDYTWEYEKKGREEKLKRASYKFKTRVQLYFLWLIAKFHGSKTIALMIPDLSKKEALQLMYSSNFHILPLSAKKISHKICYSLLHTQPDVALRSTIRNIKSEDGFSKIILELLVHHIPLSFIENYKNECRISAKRYPYFVKVVLGAPSTGDESVNLWIAKNRKQGVKRGDLQHGGGYGIVKSLSREFWDHNHLDFFISWGMKSKHKVISAPVIPISKEIITKKGYEKRLRQNENIIWVTTEYPKYPWCEIRNLLGANQQQKLYYAWQRKVLALLNPAIFSKVVMRLRYTDFSDSWKFLRDDFPDLKLHKPEGRSSYYDHIWTAKLLLFDNLNTTFYFGLAMNIPSILFWDEKNFPIRNEVKCYFDALQNAGIYHKTPESAASMINEVGDEPLKWWHRTAVQQARQQFCNYFATSSEHWLKDWKNILLTLLEK